MQLVIDINERLYKIIKSLGLVVEDEDAVAISEAIRKGTPLPKGHGDLIDRDAVNDKFYEIWQELECYSNKPTYKELLDRWSGCLDTSPAIIKEENEE